MNKLFKNSVERKRRRRDINIHKAICITVGIHQTKIFLCYSSTKNGSAPN